MLAVSSRVARAGARGFVLGASALLHVAVFAVAAHGGLPSGGLGLADTNAATEIAVDVNSDPIPQEVAHPLEHHHTHTHAYPVAPDHDAVDHDESIEHAPYLPHDHDHPADAPSDIVTAPASAPAALPNFSISIGNAPSSHGVVQTNGIGTGAVAPADDDAPIAADHVAEAAHLLSSVLPAYPADARTEEVEADVPLEIVVDKSGVVKSVHPLGHVGYGFDEAAITAMRHYRFSPAARGGHAVAVRMPWTVQFRLK